MTPPGRSPPASPTGQGSFIQSLCPPNPRPRQNLIDLPPAPRSPLLPGHPPAHFIDPPSISG